MVESKPKPDKYEEARKAGLIPCPFCKTHGRAMFFASDQDLRAHVESWHRQDAIHTEHEVGR